MTKRVAIIGAGIGGIATANILAKAGYKVHVFEKGERPGGRAGQLKVKGFTFDTGPSWYLMPEVFSQYFQLFNLDVTKELDLIKLDPAYKVFFESGEEALTIHTNLRKDAATFEAIEPGAGKQLAHYLKEAELRYDMALKYFLYTNFASYKKLLARDVLTSLPKVAQSSLRSIDAVVSKHFHNTRLKQILEYPMVFLGSSPFQAPSLFSLMSHMDFNQGVFYPQGGLYTIIEALLKISEQYGVTYHLNTPVKKIKTSHGHAEAVQLQNGKVFAADIVISNADLAFTERSLLSKADRTYPHHYWQKKQASPSAILIYLGIKGNLPKLTHHNLIFAKDWSKNFDEIFKSKTMPKSASLYVCKPSATDPSVAPKQHENVFVLVPIPAGIDLDDTAVAQWGSTYIQQIIDHTGERDFRDDIVYKKIVGPRYFREQFNAWQGTALGLSHLLNQSALFRPSNISKKVNNLYYVGANTMPGIGLPMCLISAQLVYKRLIGDTSATPLQSIEGFKDV